MKPRRTLLRNASRSKNWGWPRGAVLGTRGHPVGPRGMWATKIIKQYRLWCLSCGSAAPRGGNQTMNVTPESRNWPLMNLKPTRDRRKGHQARNYKDEIRAWWPFPGKKPITYSTG
nr:MAG TPA: hypothetical protein [Caudoviricetes sp.]